MEGESVDLCHSGGILEHQSVEELRGVIAEIHRVLKPGGISSHVFDHRDHLYHADKRMWFLNHLRYSEGGYRLLFGHRLLFHNRLMPGEIENLFLESGFDKVAIRRLILADRPTYVDQPEEAIQGKLGLPRELLAPAFRGASDADLHTAAAHYIFKKR